MEESLASLQYNSTIIFNRNVIPAITWLLKMSFRRHLDGMRGISAIPGTLF